ncbi:AI-2E family transporter [Rhizobium sp. BK512]|uniref:AI-2E family transporter n=1 Tax=Rhizobium sp. BK512 TaxID=2587010 RepID=UPI00161BD012|nr:AI-2E family transporter [Rhizobium sp. BK512]
MRAGRQRAVSSAEVVIAVLVVIALLPASAPVIAPLAFALLAIALLWPVQHGMQAFLPKYVALLATLTVVMIALLAFAWIFSWSFGRVGGWMISNAARFQQHYDEVRQWLEEQGIDVDVLWANNVGTASVVRMVQTVTTRLNSTFSFWLVALTYLLLGVMEVEGFASRLKTMPYPVARQLLLDGSRQTAEKLRRYMRIRTIMSIVTGLVVWGFTSAFGLPLAKEWGAIAFVLNYIPFIGPLVATLLPTAFALIQFDNWQSALTLFLGLNLIQFTLGSYIEPRVSGNALSLSPVVVLFSVFAWGYLWGIFGAFIGVPISIALVTFCRNHPSSRWVSELLGRDSEDDHGDDSG